MKQTTRTLLTMLALLVVAGGIALAALWAQKDEEKKTAEKERSEKLFDFDKAHARSLRLEKAGKLVAALERKDQAASWLFTEPIKGEADDATVNAMLDGLAGFKQKKDLAGEKDPKPYGLDAPQIVISAKTDDGREQRLEIGSENPFDHSLYVRKAGDPVIRLADAGGKTPFEKDLFDLRDKRVAHLEETAVIRRIEAVGTKVPYTLSKDGTLWKLVSPAGPADVAVADGIAASLKRLKATGIASESATVLATYGLAPAKVTMKIAVAEPGSKDTVTRTLLFGQPGPQKGSVAVKTYAKRDDSPTVYEVDAQILKDLDKDLFELQDKQLLNITREDVRRIVLESPGAAAIDISRTKDTPTDGGTAEENFTVTSPARGPTKKWKLSSALYTITGLRSVGFHDKAPKDPKALAKLGLDKPRVLTVYGDKDKILGRVQIGAETVETKRRFVIADGMDRVAEVEKGSVDDLPWKLEDALDAPAPPAASLPDAGVAAAH